MSVSIRKTSTSNLILLRSSRLSGCHPAGSWRGVCGLKSTSKLRGLRCSGWVDRVRYSQLILGPKTKLLHLQLVGSHPVVDRPPCFSFRSCWHLRLWNGGVALMWRIHNNLLLTWFLLRAIWSYLAHPVGRNTNSILCVIEVSLWPFCRPHEIAHWLR